MSDIFSDSDLIKRDVPSFIEPRPPLITNPFMRPRPHKGTNLMELFEESSVCDEPELVQVYLRLKPCSKSSHDDPNNLYDVRGDRHLITSLDTITAGHGRRTQHNVSKMYTFSRIFRDGTSQEDIFEHVVKGNLRKLQDGHNFTLLTYGASGSGKTYTLMGTVNSPGLIPRSLEYLFKSVEIESQPLYKPVEGTVERLHHETQKSELLFLNRLRKLSIPLRDKYKRMSCRLSNELIGNILKLQDSARYYVWVSFIEIYNEGIYDLLTATDRKTSSKLQIREDSNGNVYVKGATQAFVRSGAEAYDVMAAGKHNLQVAATGVHAQSSRSHCIFTITMIKETDSGCTMSCVRLCDLAGCERARRTRNTGARMQESRAINSSLHVLERCLHMLRRKQTTANNALVPYRESKLTRLLGAGLSGTRGESISMVVTLNPSPEYAHETKHVLQLAAVAKDLQINNTLSEYPSSLESSTQDINNSMNNEIMNLRTCNERLHFELLQAQTRNKELLATIDAKSAANADTMRELVKAVEQNSRQYYETKLEALYQEMEEMKEEYEAKINDLTQRLSGATPRNNTVDQLMTEIALLKESLSQEKFLRNNVDIEVQHLRACIDERDENEKDNNNENINNDDMNDENVDVLMSGSESDTEADNNDVGTESLEPVFRKEDLERSRIIRKSLMMKQDNESSNDSVLNSSDNTLKDSSNSDSDQDDCPFNDSIIASCKKSSVLDINENLNRISSNTDLVSVKLSPKKSYFFNDVDTNKSEEETRNLNVKKVNKDYNSYIDEVDKATEIVAIQTGSTVKRNKLVYNRTDSLVKFEQIELESRINNDLEESSTGDNFGTNILKRVEGFFNNGEKYFRTTNEACGKNIKNDDKSPDSIQDNVRYKYEQIMIKKLLNKNLTKFVDDKLKETKTDNDDMHTSLQKNQDVPLDSANNHIIITTPEKQKMSRDLFDSPIISQTTTKEITNNYAILKSEENYIKTNENISYESSRCESPIFNQLSKKEEIIIHSNNHCYDVSDVRNALAMAIDSIPKIKIDEKDTRYNCDVNNSINDASIKNNDLSKTDIVVTIENAKDTNDKAKTVFNDLFKVPACKEYVKTNLKKVSHGMESSTNLEIGSDNIITKGHNSEKVKDIDTEDLQATFNKIKSPSPIQDNRNNKMEIIAKVTEKASCFEEHETMNIDIESTPNLPIDNTLEVFESIYKNITSPRATQFDLLVSQTEDNNEVRTEPEVKYNLRKKSNKLKSQDSKEGEATMETKEIIDKKDKAKMKGDRGHEILLESHLKCEVKKKKNLRLRRCKEDLGEEKLRNIVNLQTQFSDVTMDTPAPRHIVDDIPSPEENEDENIPPNKGFISSMSKSVTRSRRKLFTPRAEPLEEGRPQTEGSNEQIRVPRPSYHRPRARRKL